MAKVTRKVETTEKLVGVTLELNLDEAHALLAIIGNDGEKPVFELRTEHNIYDLLDELQEAL